MSATNEKIGEKIIVEKDMIGLTKKEVIIVSVVLIGLFAGTYYYAKTNK